MLKKLKSTFECCLHAATGFDPHRFLAKRKIFYEKYSSKYTNTRSALRKEMEGQKKKADGKQGVYLFAAFNSMF